MDLERETPKTLHDQGAVLVLFGASGDLARRKLVPALFNVFKQGLLPAHFSIVGFARTAMNSDGYRDWLSRDMPPAQSRDPAWLEFLRRVEYTSGDYGSTEAFAHLDTLVAKRERCPAGRCLRLYYLATPPAVFPVVGESLRRMGPPQGWGGSHARVAIEKPFGRDQDSAKALNRVFRQSFNEEQIYRIDHYLGKETVQNILFLRFANGIFEPLWNRNYIDHLQFTVAEELVLEGRVGYYDAAGALRDIMQNHLLQLLCLVTMEPPTSLHSEAVRDQKVNVLKSLRKLESDEVLMRTARGQYASGVHNGRSIVGYLAEEGIPDDSKTETYAAWRLEVDNWRWHGVPMYMRSGKGLKRKASEIAIQFRQVPHVLFAERRREPGPVERRSNLLRLRLQPNEGIELKIDVKSPGASLQTTPVELNFHYEHAFDGELVDAYERLMLDLVAGDRTLFTREDEVDIAWEHVTNVLDVWRAQDQTPGFALPQYTPGAWGPATGDALIARDGRHWLIP